MQGSGGSDESFPKVHETLLDNLWLEATQARSVQNKGTHSRRGSARGRLILMLCDFLSVVVSCEMGICTDLPILRVVSLIATVAAAVGCRFRFAWLPSERFLWDGDSRRFEPSPSASTTSTCTKVPSTTSSALGGRESCSHDLTPCVQLGDGRALHPSSKSTVLPSSRILEAVITQQKVPTARLPRTNSCQRPVHKQLDARQWDVLSAW